MSIDVEGSELSVLKNFDFHKFKPKIIVVEYLDLSLKKLEIKNLNIQKSIMKLFNSIISEVDRETHPGFSDLNKKFTYQEKKEKETEKYKCCITC